MQKNEFTAIPLRQEDIAMLIYALGKVQNSEAPALLRRRTKCLLHYITKENRELNENNSRRHQARGRG